MLSRVHFTASCSINPKREMIKCFSPTERSSFFCYRPDDIAYKIKPYEKLCEDPVFDSGGSDLHGWFCGGQAELQKDRQELSHERQQGMQLREELRLR
jgi:hypothetical protein